MSDPNDLARQGDYLERRLNRNTGGDLASLLTAALGGYPEEAVEEVEEPIAHEPAVDALQGRAQIWTAGAPSGGDLEGQLAAAVGLGAGLTLKRNGR